MGEKAKQAKSKKEAICNLCLDSLEITFLEYKKV